jgi:hypothetical protein
MQGSFLFADIPWFTCMMYALYMTVQEFTKKHDAEENQSYFDYSLWCTNVINAVWSTAHFVIGDTTVDLKQFIPLLQDAVTAAANDGVTLAVSTCNLFWCLKLLDALVIKHHLAHVLSTYIGHQKPLTLLLVIVSITAAQDISCAMAYDYTSILSDMASYCSKLTGCTHHGSNRKENTHTLETLHITYATSSTCD